MPLVGTVKVDENALDLSTAICEFLTFAAGPFAGLLPYDPSLQLIWR